MVLNKFVYLLIMAKQLQHTKTKAIAMKDISKEERNYVVEEYKIKKMPKEEKINIDTTKL